MILPYIFTIPRGFAAQAERAAKDIAGPRVSNTANDVVSFRCPLNCAWLFAQTLQEAGVPVLHVRAPNRAAPDGSPWNSTDVENGRRLVSLLIEEGFVKAEIEVKPGVFKPTLEFLAPYQIASPAWSHRRPWTMKIWAPGGGKTLGAFLTAMVQAYATLSPWAIAAPAKARNNVWGRQLERYAGERVSWASVTPESLRRKSYVPIKDHLDHCRSNKLLPTYIIGTESLPDYWKELVPVRPGVLTFDEIHTLSDRKRWEQKPGKDGKRELSLRKNRAAAAWELSKLPSIFFREGLTATPMGSGLPRSLYAQLTLLDLSGWGSYWDFAARYAAAHEHPELGFMVDTGATNLEELRARASFFVHEVSYQESHGHLPPLRWEVYEVEQGRQGKPTGKRELEREIGRGGPDAKMELAIALAASRKEKAAIEDMLEVVRWGQKVVIFTIRHHLCERLQTQLVEALKRAKLDVPVFWGHGGHSQKFRDEQFEGFISAPGAAVFNGTGDAWGTAVDGFQCAHLAQILGFPWTPTQLDQWKGRFDRPEEGKTEGTVVRFYYAAGTIEDKVISRLVERIGNIEQFMSADSLKGAAAKLNQREDDEAFRKKMIAWALSSGGSDDE